MRNVSCVPQTHGRAAALRDVILSLLAFHYFLDLCGPRDPRVETDLSCRRLYLGEIYAQAKVQPVKSEKDADSDCSHVVRVGPDRDQYVR